MRDTNPDQICFTAFSGANQLFLPNGTWVFLRAGNLRGVISTPWHPLGLAQHKSRDL
jgi:hypothetical protein